MKKDYITTPIYYANDVPHIGHAYTTVAADVWARQRRLAGHPVHFLTGTDEHGAKIAQAAQAANKTPLDYLTPVVDTFRALWTRLNISHDDFIRTTEPRHVTAVQEVFETLKSQGDIYLGTYEDWYCVPDETFWNSAELADGRCPACGRAVERLKEESYFFRLSRYQDRLLEHYEKSPAFLSPRSRAGEIVNFVRSGLRDLSVSRTRVAWGIPVPSHPPHTVYVWFDALLNYVTALGYRPGAPSPEFLNVWPADVHLVGKEIFRFHAVIWPAMLMALDLPMPDRVFAHGWWTVEGEKMSKSRGNVVDPHAVVDRVGVDPFRYFLLREVPFGNDGDFSQKSLLARYNAELANGLGNLFSRTAKLLETHFEGRPDTATADHTLVPPNAKDWLKQAAGAVDQWAFHTALDGIMDLVHRANKFAEDRAPWALVKTDRARALATLTELVRALKLATLALAPFMPTVCDDMWRRLGEPGPLDRAAAGLMESGVITFAPGQTIRGGPPLFPRLDRHVH